MNIFPGRALPRFYDSFNQRFVIQNPFILVTFTLIIVFYYVVFKYLGAGAPAPMMPVAETGGIKIIEVIMWALFIFLVLINGLQYFFSLDIKASIKNIFAPTPEVDIKIEDKKPPPPPPAPKKVPEIMIEKQVFNIPHQRYTYDEADALCAAYGANLASYDNILSAYKSGAEWCNYGWSQDQMIFYPTQKKTYDGLQQLKGREHNCGRVGINGGYFQDKHTQFGVNCYGYKPEITPQEQATLGDNPWPPTKAEVRFNTQVKEFRNNLPQIKVSPFNNSKWSKI